MSSAGDTPEACVPEQLFGEPVVAEQLVVIPHDAAHVTAVKLRQAADKRPDTIAGTSLGGFYAAEDSTLDNLEEAFDDLCISLPCIES